MLNIVKKKENQMVIVINYNSQDDKIKSNVKSITNKIVESNYGTFVDIGSQMNLFMQPIPSLDFTILVKRIHEAVSKDSKNIIIDGFILSQFLNAFDDFQKIFINETINSLGRIDVFIQTSVDDIPIALTSKYAVKFDVDVDFFIDFEKRLKSEVEKIESETILPLINAIDACGYYLGTCDVIKNINNAELVVISGSSGQKISYEEFIDWLLSKWDYGKLKIANISDLNLDRYVFVRQHHPVEFILKKIFKKQKKNI